MYLPQHLLTLYIATGVNQNGTHLFPLGLVRKRNVANSLAGGFCLYVFQYIYIEKIQICVECFGHIMLCEERVLCARLKVRVLLLSLRFKS